MLLVSGATHGFRVNSSMLEDMCADCKMHVLGLQELEQLHSTSNLTTDKTGLSSTSSAQVPLLSIATQDAGDAQSALGRESPAAAPILQSAVHAASVNESKQPQQPRLKSPCSQGASSFAAMQQSSTAAAQREPLLQATEEADAFQQQATAHEHSSPSHQQPAPHEASSPLAAVHNYSCHRPDGKLLFEGLDFQVQTGQQSSMCAQSTALLCN